MAEYTYTLTPNTDALDEQIRFAGLDDDLEGLTVDWSTDPPTVTVITLDELDAADEATLDAVIAAHDPQVPSVDQRITAARKFARALIAKWQKVILLDGVVQAGQAHVVASALATSTIHANYGNLYALDEELGVVDPIPTFLEAGRITEIRNEIRTFLGMPLL